MTSAIDGNTTSEITSVNIASTEKVVVQLKAEDIQSVIRACGKLAVELLQTTSESNETSLVSAYSLLPVMGMLVKGMSNSSDKVKTLEELGLAHMTEETVHAAIGELARGLLAEQEKHGFTLTSVNALFSVSSEVKPEYKQAIQEAYGAAIFENQADLAGVINRWAEENTNGLIKEIVSDEEVKSCVAALANAIYFKGSWEDKFDANRTVPVAFKGLDGEEKKVQMMNMNGNKGYYGETAEFQIYKKPYHAEEGRKISHFFLLPKDGTSVQDAEANMNPGKLSKLITQRLYKNDVIFSCPRMKIETEVDGIDSKLTQYPLKTSYEAMAPRLQLSKVKQMAAMTVNEEGAEAAAVTVALLAKCVSMPERMSLDRPFIHGIVDETHGEPAVLFVGTVKDTDCLETE